MKICPYCQNTYTDDSLQFCLQDGQPLENYTPNQTSGSQWSDAETLVSPKMRSQPPLDAQKSQNWQPSEPTILAAQTPEPEKSNTLKIVLLTLLGMLVLFGIGGIGAFVVWKKSQREIAANVNNNKPVNTKTPAANQNANSNQNTNANVNANANANSAAPPPKPTINPEQTEEIKEKVKNVIDDWKTAYESLDLEYAVSYYAETVDYYNGGRVGIGRVRADKQRAFDAYDTLKFDISNLTVTPDSTGEKATAVFDKEWNFENVEKTNSGKVQQQMQFIKKDGKWKIAGEKDLKVYYINK